MYTMQWVNISITSQSFPSLSSLYFVCVVRTQHKIYSLQDILSVLYSIVSDRHYAAS